jgi:hypothetical protein
MFTHFTSVNQYQFLKNRQNTVNGYKKAKEALAVKAGIQCVINLENDNSVLEYMSKETPWYHKLVMEGKVIGLSMGFIIPGVEANERKLKAALRFIIAHEGPYLIHCFAGVDRTGFVAALLEALMGASLKEIIRDYLSAFGPDYSGSYRLGSYRQMKNLLTQLKRMVHGKKLTFIVRWPCLNNFLTYFLNYGII